MRYIFYSKLLESGLQQTQPNAAHNLAPPPLCLEELKVKMHQTSSGKLKDRVLQKTATTEKNPTRARKVCSKGKQEPVCM